jgi:hypothetical protein
MSGAARRAELTEIYHTAAAGAASEFGPEGGAPEARCRCFVVITQRILPVDTG